MQPRVSVEELLQDLGDEAAGPGGGRSDEQRARVVAAMRRTHVEVVHDRPRTFRPRTRTVLLLVAAVAALSGTALAARGGLEKLGRWLEQERTAATSHAAPPSTNGEPRRVGPSPEPRMLAVSPAAMGSATATAQPSAVTPPQPGSRAQHKTATTAHEPDDRELAAVNELFSEAKRARREHRDADALAYCEKLLAEFPRSVLAQDASVERFRALARLGRTAEARRFAARYLASYPNGFAAAEARALTADANESTGPAASDAPRP